MQRADLPAQYEVVVITADILQLFHRVVPMSADFDRLAKIQRSTGNSSQRAGGNGFVVDRRKVIRRETDPMACDRARRVSAQIPVSVVG